MMVKKPYKHIFFDLDRTLWDFETNSRKALGIVIDNFKLGSNIQNSEVFFNTYNRHNEYFWGLFGEGKIKKQDIRKQRFYYTLRDFGIDDFELGIQINDFYMHICPGLPETLPGTHKLLKYLNDKYRLYIISNGFYDVQMTKLKSSNILPFFTHIFTSDKTGYTKPTKEMFMQALNSVNAKKTESVMIGDDYTNDILGAKNFGIDQIFYCPDGGPDNSATYTVKKLEDIMEIL